MMLVMSSTPLMPPTPTWISPTSSGIGVPFASIGFADVHFSNSALDDTVSAPVRPPLRATYGVPSIEIVIGAMRLLATLNLTGNSDGASAVGPPHAASNAPLVSATNGSAARTVTREEPIEIRLTHFWLERL